MALSFVTILFFGKRLPKKGAEVGIAGLFVCLAFSIGAGVQWIDRVNHPPEATGHAEVHAFLPLQEEEHGDGHAEGGGAVEGEAAEEHHEVAPVLTEATWMEIGPHEIKVGTFVDGLS